jgi:polyphosphate kinase 2
MKRISRKKYERVLHDLQVELVKLQRHFIGCGDRILVIFEGRDAAGKDGTIKRIVEHLSPRETRVVALGKPSDRERGAWYFQRYVPYLPVAGEFVLFNRSWYNRAGVERVMGFCSDAEYEEFMEAVPGFEAMLVRSGTKLLKYYLDISKEEQRERLKERARDPLTQWKTSPIDARALRHWKDYSRARDQMLRRTHNEFAPWRVVRADDKKAARINVMRDILGRLHYEGKDARLVMPDASVVFEFDESSIRDGRLSA